MNESFAICDMGNEYLLGKNGNWYEKPMDEDEIALLVTFATRAEAEAFCLAKAKLDVHCRPYALA